MVGYWSSFNNLKASAKNPNDPHLPNWRAFNKKVGASGDVGVYHETYHVEAGQHESIYSNMPIMELAAAAGSFIAVGQTYRHRTGTYFDEQAHQPEKLIYALGED